MSASPPSCMGEQRAVSTEHGYVRARVIFNEFLSVMLLKPLKPSASASVRNADYCTAKDVCKIEIFQRFAQYLYEQTNEDGSSHFTYGSALQYLSGAKMIVERVYGAYCIEKSDSAKAADLNKKSKFQQIRGDTAPWYSQLRHDTEKKFVGRCFERGTVASDIKNSHCDM